MKWNKTCHLKYSGARRSATDSSFATGADIGSSSSFIVTVVQKQVALKVVNRGQDTAATRPMWAHLPGAVPSAVVERVAHRARGRECNEAARTGLCSVQAEKAAVAKK